MGPFSMLAPTASADGYGYSAEALILAATDRGADIAFVSHDWRDERYTDQRLLDLRVDDREFDAREVLVVYFLPFALTRFRARQTFGMTMWETDRLPDSWVACSRLADGMIVPCEHSKRLFTDRLDLPVEVVPFGTDVDLYSVPRSRRDRPLGEFHFLMAGLLHYRKGVEFALRALREEFEPSEPVRLTLKTRRGFLDAGEEFRTLSDPRVSVVDEDFTRQQMRDLYHCHDAFVACSRGEGSGLTPRDAMATGLPTLVTDWGGLSEIADPRYAYPIPVDALEPAPANCSSYAEGITGSGSIGNFARPSVPALRVAMREVYEDHRAEATLRGVAAAEWMREEWTWDRSAARFLAALDRLTEKVVV